MTSHNRTRMPFSLAIVMIVMAASVPVVAMIGCSMEMSAPLSMARTMCAHIEAAGTFISQACGGTYVALDGLVDSIAPDAGFSVTLLAALAVAAMMFVVSPARTIAPVPIRAEPPPPPEDPLGSRLSI